MIVLVRYPTIRRDWTYVTRVKNMEEAVTKYGEIAEIVEVKEDVDTDEFWRNLGPNSCYL